MKTHIQARSWKEAERLGIVPGVTACGRFERGKRVVITPTNVTLTAALAFPGRVTCDACRAALGEATAVVEQAKAA